MAILVTGSTESTESTESTGRVGTRVVSQLARSGRNVHALTRSPKKAQFPAGVPAVKGNAPDELTQAIDTLGLARGAGVQGIVYLSVTGSADCTDVSHFTAKHAVERMIEQMDLPATVLRPSCFVQNDALQKDPLQKAGLYVAPVRDVDVSMVDVRDIADAAVLELPRRDRAETDELCGPDALTGESLAALWTETLGQDVCCAGNDLGAFEKNVKARAPASMAYDMRAMMNRYQHDGAVASLGVIDQLTVLLGRPARRYRNFAAETAQVWQE